MIKMVKKTANKSTMKPSERGLNEPGKTDAKKQGLAPSRHPKPAKSLTKTLVPTPSAAVAQPERSIAPSGTLTQAPNPAVSQKTKVSFVLLETVARSVSVSGEFNGWSKTPLELYGSDTWKVDLELAPGRYEYKFIVDGQWVIDPMARESVFNSYGTLNSVIEARC